MIDAPLFTNGHAPSSLVLQTRRVDYQWTHDAIVYHFPLRDDLMLSLRAADIQRDYRTSDVVATLTVHANGSLVVLDRVKCASYADLTHLANAAHKILSGNLPWVKEVYPAERLRNELMLFCYGLWNEVVAEALPSLMAGEPNPLPPQMLIHPLLMEGGGTILFGPPGRGKSYLAQLLMVSLDAGLSTYWRVKEPAKVLYLNLERSERSVRARLGLVNRALGLPPERGIATLNARGRSLVDVLHSARRYVREHGVEAVFLDSLSRAGFGDLNENAPVNRVMDALNSLAPTWLAIGHTPRSDDSHVYGSQMFDAAADLAAQVSSQQEEDGPLGVGIALTKSNDLPKSTLPILALEFSPIGLAGVRLAHPGEFPEVESGRKLSLKGLIREYILDLPTGKASATELGTALGRSRSKISEALQDETQFVSLGRDGGHQVFFGVRGTP